MQSNPSLLTQQQFNMLQAAGLISGTLPYSSVSQIGSPLTNSSTAVPDPTATVSSGTDISSVFSAIPLWGWVAAGGLAIFLFSGKRGR